MCNVAVSYLLEVKLLHTFVYCVDYLELLGMMLVVCDQSGPTTLMVRL